MAETKANQSDRNEQTVATRDRQKRGEMQRDRGIQGAFGDPFEFMNRMSEEMDRTFDRLWRDMGLQRRRSWLPQGLFGRQTQDDRWTPRLEAFQKDDRFIVRAELPGLKKDDVELELTDDALTIRGERRHEHQEEREGYFHSEWEYGQFQRVIALPEGVIAESAEATFRDGVLEVSMPAPPQETRRARKVEIRESSEAQGNK